MAPAGKALADFFPRVQFHPMELPVGAGEGGVLAQAEAGGVIGADAGLGEEAGYGGGTGHPAGAGVFSYALPKKGHQNQRPTPITNQSTKPASLPPMSTI